jgi:hypothetical protein
MPSVAELSALYGNFMLSPRHGPDVCEICFNLTDGYKRCYACTHGELWLDGVLPISYSVGLEQLHHVLRTYKRRGGEAARRHRVELAAVLWRFLAGHERCLAQAVGQSDAFDVVTTVPSGARARDEEHPLHWIVGSLVGPTRGRFRRLLSRTASEVDAREFSPHKFVTDQTDLSDRSVLLIDDTWTTGASAQSAAATLKNAGAARVGAIVIGRHVNRDWSKNDQRLRRLDAPYDWSTCALCARTD